VEGQLKHRSEAISILVRWAMGIKEEGRE
jgi:hypothetical protein